MGKIYEDMYQAFLKVSGNWDDPVAYEVYAAAVKKYLGATKFLDGIERGKVTVELARRRINERRLEHPEEFLDEDPVLDERYEQEVRLEPVGPGQTSDADGYCDVRYEYRRTTELDQPEEPGRAAVAPGNNDRREGVNFKDQSLGVEVVRNPLQGRTRQDRSSKLPGDNILRPQDRTSADGDTAKGRRNNPNPKNKRVRRAREETRE